MFELRSTLAASAVTAAVGLAIIAAPATAAGTATSAKSATATKASTKKKAAKKTTKKAPAAPKTVTACVNNKSGATKVLLGAKAKKKCAKGWTKMTWNVAGQAGKNGANGTNGANGANGVNGVNGVNGANGSVSVRDSTGKRIGGFGGYFSLGLSISLMQVIADDGGVYTYLDSTGQLLPFTALGGGGSPLFKDAACAGAAYLPAAGASVFGSTGLTGGSARLAYRPVTGMSLFDLGPTRAWKLTSSLSVVPGIVPTFYELDATGGCVALVEDPSEPGSEVPVEPGDYLLQLAPAVAPPDGVGPLTVG